MKEHRHAHESSDLAESHAGEVFQDAAARVLARTSLTHGRDEESLAHALAQYHKEDAEDRRHQHGSNIEDLGPCVELLSLV